MPRIPARLCTHKLCPRCIRTLPIDQFHVKDKRTGNLLSHCRDCMRESSLLWHRKNRKKILERIRLERVSNPEKTKAKDRENYKRNAESRRAQARLYTKNNREKIKAARLRDRENRLAQAKLYREANRDRLRQQAREYYAANKEACAARVKKCRAAKRDEYCEVSKGIKHRRRVTIASNGPVEKFKDLEIFVRDNWTCKICGFLIDRGAVYPDSLSVSLDHIVPISRGGSHTRANVQCAHLKCNLAKRNYILPMVD